MRSLDRYNGLGNIHDGRIAESYSVFVEDSIATSKVMVRTTLVGQTSAAADLAELSSLPRTAKNLGCL